MSTEDDLEVVTSPLPRVILGEGPSWSIRDQVLYWIDIRGKRLFTHNFQDKDDKQYALDQIPGCGKRLIS